MNDVELGGCRSEPLASYLKALAVLRLVAIQKDEKAKGVWKQGVFHLISALDRDEVVRFLADEYQPSPIVSPWNGGSGFYEGDNKEAIEKIQNTINQRFQNYKNAIREILSWAAIPKKKPPKDKKQLIIELCRNKLGDDAIDWIDAAVVLANSGRPQYPPILGSGGNEGRLEYSNTFMRWTTELLLNSSISRKDATEMLENSLFGTPSNKFVPVKMGQFYPGRAGGYNQCQGEEEKDFKANPWDIVLALEGTMLWTSGITSRMHTLGAGEGAVSSPFTVRTEQMDAATAKEGARGEIWVPLWRNPATYYELRSFLAQGRIGAEPRKVVDSLTFAAAIESLSGDYGLSEFIRYGFLKRRGESYLAVPVDHFKVRRDRTEGLIEGIYPKLRSIRAQLKNPPASVLSAIREIERALYDASKAGGTPLSVKRVVVSVGRLEKTLAKSKLAKPLPPLRLEWGLKAFDGSPEVKLAASIASIQAFGGLGPLRANITPINPTNPRKWAVGHDQVAWTGNSLSERLVKVLEYRMRWGDKTGSDKNPLRGQVRLDPTIVAKFIKGEINEAELEDLIFGFATIDWGWKKMTPSIKQKLIELEQGDELETVPTSYKLLKMVFLAGEVNKGNERIQIRREPAILNSLRMGNVRAACSLAEKRLASSGLKTTNANFYSSCDPTRLAAALLIPVKENYVVRSISMR